jgi:hypothetical protein
MMKVMSQFVISVFDLIEAEGRTLLAVARNEAGAVHGGVVKLAMAFAFLLAFVPLFIVGALLLAVGLMWGLETQMGRPLAAELTGCAVLIIAFSCLFIFRSLSNKRAS